MSLVVLLVLLSINNAFAITSVDLDRYEVVATYALPPADLSQNPALLYASEASAVTYNWDTNTLFVVGDEGGMIVEMSLDGVMLSTMAIYGFNDPEGLTYTGNGDLVIVEERNRDVYQIHYVAGSYLFRNTDNAIDLGDFVDNIGIEGISYDPRDGSYITVKEKTPQEVNINQLDWVNHSAVINSLFDPASLAVADIADVQVLATVPTLSGTADEDNLLLFSQESEVLLKVDRSGNVLQSFDFSAYASSAEGVTIDPDGNIYIVAENGDAPQMFKLSPIEAAPVSVPLPFWAMVLLASVLVSVSIRFRK